MLFKRYIGIDYSGRDLPTKRLSGLQLFEASVNHEPSKVYSKPGKNWNWCRKEIAEWLIKELETDQRIIVGVDHCFSFPLNKFDSNETWAGFLERFTTDWKSHEQAVKKADIVNTYPDCGKLLRLTEKWTSSAKSTFDCNGPGVACSTFAGLPWLREIRQEVGALVHFWPFDGWIPPAEKSVIAEVYPSLFHNRYERESRTSDEHDAYSTARWLKETDERGFLNRYFTPPLTIDERVVASREGWILGV